VGCSAGESGLEPTVGCLLVAEPGLKTAVGYLFADRLKPVAVVLQSGLESVVGWMAGVVMSAWEAFDTEHLVAEPWG
jgi:hypothetical protein